MKPTALEFGELINGIALTLMQPIPEPKQQRPRDQKSWKTIDCDGRELVLIAPYLELGPLVLNAGDKVAVTRCTNQGIVLRPYSHPHQSFWWRDPEWKLYWAKVRKQPRKRVNK